MMMALQSLGMSVPAALALLDLDIDGYLTGQEFLSVLANLVSSLILTLLGLLFGVAAPA